MSEISAMVLKLSTSQDCFGDQNLPKESSKRLRCPKSEGKTKRTSKKSRITRDIAGTNDTTVEVVTTLSLEEMMIVLLYLNTCYPKKTEAETILYHLC